MILKIGDSVPLRRGPKEVLADGGVEVFNVEANKAGALMVLCRFEPVNYRCGVFSMLLRCLFFRLFVVGGAVVCSGIRFRRVLSGMGGRLGQRMLCRKIGMKGVC